MATSKIDLSVYMITGLVIVSTVILSIYKIDTSVFTSALTVLLGFIVGRTNIVDNVVLKAGKALGFSPKEEVK